MTTSSSSTVNRAAQGSFFDRYFAELRARLSDASDESLALLCETLSGARARRRKVVIAGNGASAAIASHVAVDLTKAAGIRSVTFNEPDLITCFGNDYGYENWVAKAIDFYADSGDVAVCISSSGKSANMVNAAGRARELGLQVVTLSGFAADNPLRQLGHLNLWVNSSSYNVVETTHQSWLLAAVDNLVAAVPTS